MNRQDVELLAKIQAARVAGVDQGDVLRACHDEIRRLAKLDGSSRARLAAGLRRATELVAATYEQIMLDGLETAGRKVKP